MTESRIGVLSQLYVNGRLKRGEITPDTARNSRYIVATFACSFGQRPVERMGRGDVERWLEGIGHLAPATRRKRFSVVQGLCRWLVVKGHVRRDPTVGIRAPRQPRSIPRALPMPSIAAVFECCPDARAVAIVTLMVQQGLRCCEVAYLQRGDLDRLNGQMRVVGKGGHERILPITDETAEAIDRYLYEYPAPAGRLIRSYVNPCAGLKPDTISKLVGEWIVTAGIKQARRDGVSAHAFRHSAATDMLRAGAHIRDVQHALGHAHLATTEIYLPLVVHGLDKAMGGRRYRYPALDATANPA